MKHLRDRNAAGAGLVDERLHVLQERGQLITSPVRPLAKGLLDVDDNECLLHGVPPLAQALPAHRRSWAPLAGCPWAARGGPRNGSGASSAPRRPSATEFWDRGRSKTDIGRGRGPREGSRRLRGAGIAPALPAQIRADSK